MFYIIRNTNLLKNKPSTVVFGFDTKEKKLTKTEKITNKQKINQQKYHLQLILINFKKLTLMLFIQQSLC